MTVTNANDATDDDSTDAINKSPHTPNYSTDLDSAS